MKTGKFDFVEGLLMVLTFGLGLPLGVIEADKFYMGAADVALLMGFTHFVMIFILGVCASMEQHLLGRVVMAATAVGLGGLVGAALYKCLAVSLGAGVDWTSVASGTIIGGSATLTILSYAALADTMKKMNK